MVKKIPAGLILGSIFSGIIVLSASIIGSYFINYILNFISFKNRKERRFVNKKDDKTNNEDPNEINDSNLEES